MSELTENQRRQIEQHVKVAGGISRAMANQLLDEIDRLTDASVLCSGHVMKGHPCGCYCHTQIGTNRVAELCGYTDKNGGPCNLPKGHDDTNGHSDE